MVSRAVGEPAGYFGEGKGWAGCPRLDRLEIEVVVGEAEGKFEDDGLVRVCPVGHQAYGAWKDAYFGGGVEIIIVVWRAVMFANRVGITDGEWLPGSESKVRYSWRLVCVFLQESAQNPAEHAVWAGLVRVNIMVGEGFESVPGSCVRLILLSLTDVAKTAIGFSLLAGCIATCTFKIMREVVPRLAGLAEVGIDQGRLVTRLADICTHCGAECWVIGGYRSQFMVKGRIRRRKRCLMFNRMEEKGRCNGGPFLLPDVNRYTSEPRKMETPRPGPRNNKGDV